MKKFNVSKVFLALLISLSLTSLSAHLTEEEQSKILEKCEITEEKHSEIKEYLDLLLSNDEVSEFLKCKRPVNWQAMLWSIQGEIQQRRFSGDEIEAKRIIDQTDKFVASNAIVENNFNAKFKVFKRFCEQNKIKVSGEASVIILDGLIKDHLVKIPRFSFPHMNNFYKAIGTKEKPRTSMELSPTDCQLISRVFGAQDIIVYVDKNKAKHIRPIKKYFYHIPGQSRDLVDENYIVVVEKINGLPDAEQNGIEIKKIWNSAVSGEKESSQIIVELLETMEAAGIWEFKPRNILYLPEQKAFVFIDLERPGSSGSLEVNFYHKNKKEVIRNIEAGFKEFAKFVGLGNKNIEPLVEKYVEFITQ